MTVVFSGYAGCHSFLDKMWITKMTQLPVSCYVYFRSEEGIESLKDKKRGQYSVNNLTS